MKRLTLVVVFMLLATPSFAATKKPARAAGATLYSEFVKNLEISAGWRFTPERHKHEATEVDNQFYVGLGTHLPLARTVSLFGNYDHDFTERNDWQARAGISLLPFGGRY